MFLCSLGFVGLATGQKLFTIQPDTPYERVPVETRNFFPSPTTAEPRHDFYDNYYIVNEFDVEAGKDGVATRSFKSLCFKVCLL